MRIDCSVPYVENLKLCGLIRYDATLQQWAKANKLYTYHWYALLNLKTLHEVKVLESDG